MAAANDWNDRVSPAKRTAPSSLVGEYPHEQCLECVEVFAADDLGTEAGVRSYGGGMLKLERTEADRLRVVAPEVAFACEAELRALRKPIGALLAGRRFNDAIDILDGVILEGYLGMRVPARLKLKTGGAAMSERDARQRRLRP